MSSTTEVFPNATAREVVRERMVALKVHGAEDASDAELASAADAHYYGGLEKLLADRAGEIKTRGKLAPDSACDQCHGGGWILTGGTHRNPATDLKEDGLTVADEAEELQRLLIEFDAWLSFRGEFSEVLTAFRSAFGTDTSAAALAATDDHQHHTKTDERSSKEGDRG